jgi:hypothetical protein
MELNTDHRKSIWEEMVSYRRFPENLFVGTGWRSRALRIALARSGSTRQGDLQD